MTRMSRVLIVEDDGLVRQSFVRMIEEEQDYEVHSAASCAEGLSMVSNNRYDLILTDIRLGDGTGIKVLERAKKADPQVIVFMITGYSSIQSMKEAIQKGAADYIVKPVDMDLLLLKIKSTLERHPRISDQEGNRTD